MASKHRSTQFAVEHPRAVARSLLVVTLLLLAAAGLPNLFPDALSFLPRVTIDTDPENMLPDDDPVRVFHGRAKEKFALHDAVVVGVVNEEHPDGVFNPETLAKVFKLTEFAKGLEGVIVGDLMAPSTTDSLQNTGPGSLRFDWLMPEPPATQEEALAVRDRAMRIPFLKGTLVSGDGKALVIYIPIKEKDLAHEISTELKGEIHRIGAGKDQFHIAGLPVAEDTFGIEMFIQMAISAPMAMIVIFLLMWFYFRRVSIILSPMLVAMASALITMALLVLSGNTIHIMSSMIPIFIMPIAVLDAVHIISDFFDTYPKTKDRRKTIEEVMGHLFRPMLFTSLTTAAGFASLALTPIPPVRVFGIFVALGVLAAWLITITFIPAYLMLISAKRLEGFGRKADDKGATGILGALGRMRGMHARIIVVLGVALIGVAVIGIQRINVNDNPTKWFEEDHEIRVADRVLNRHFGGTYDAYLNLRYKAPVYTAKDLHEHLVSEAKQEAEAVGAVFAELEQAIAAEQGKEAFAALETLETRVRESRLADPEPRRRVAWSLAQDFLGQEFARLDELEPGEGEAEPTLDAQTSAAASAYASTLASAYREFPDFSAKIEASKPASRELYLSALQAGLLDEGLAETTLSSFVSRQQQSLEVFKQPRLLAYLEGLQAALQQHPAVGKSNSLADIVKVVHRDLISGAETDYRLPENSDIVGQTLAQYQSSHRKDDLWHFVTTDYQEAIIWFQLKSGDNRDMQSVVDAVAAYLELNPPPIELEPAHWFGLAYINVVWQEKMVSGMVSALLGSFVVVLLMMVGLFRSVLWGLLSMIPLTLTVGLIYGILGLVGKDYDMPVAVLSSLSLGLAVDYAIHFLARSRELRNVHGSWKEAQGAVFQEPARAISRNVIVVGVGFLPLLLAPLVPYQTVGLLIASILVAAGVATLVLLPALIQILEPFLFRDTKVAKD